MAFNVLAPAMNATACLGCNKQFEYLKYLETTIDDMGRDVPVFADPVTMTGSIQAVPNKMYEQMGLQLDKNYKTVFSLALIQSIAENIQPDRIVYNGLTFEVVEDKNWYETNGYTKILVVELKELRPNEPTNNNNTV